MQPNIQKINLKNMKIKQIIITNNRFMILSLVLIDNYKIYL